MSYLRGETEDDVLKVYCKLLERVRQPSEYLRMQVLVVPLARKLLQWKLIQAPVWRREEARQFGQPFDEDLHPPIVKQAFAEMDELDRLRRIEEQSLVSKTSEDHPVVANNNDTIENPESQHQTISIGLPNNENLAPAQLENSAPTNRQKRRMPMEDVELETDNKRFKKHITSEDTNTSNKTSSQGEPTATEKEDLALFTYFMENGGASSSRSN